jgi:hypothetical protein
MAKQMGDTQTSNSQYHGKGVFTEGITIVRVEDHSNYPLQTGAPIKTIGQNGFAPQLCLKVYFEGGDKERHFTIFGSFKYQKEDKVSGKRTGYIGWNTVNNPIQSFLARMNNGKFAINDDDSIPSVLLKSVEGKKIIKLRYCRGEYEGNPSFQDWQYIYPDGEGARENLFTDFLKASPKQHDPDLYDRYTMAQQAQSETFDSAQYDDDTI